MNNTNKNFVDFISTATFEPDTCNEWFSQNGRDFVIYFSGYSWVKNRVHTEVNWLVFLLSNLKTRAFNIKHIQEIQSINYDFSEKTYSRIKELELRTNNTDIAVKTFVAEKLKKFGLENIEGFMYSYLLLKDIDSMYIFQMVSSALKKVWHPKAKELTTAITDITVKLPESKLAKLKRDPAFYTNSLLKHLEDITLINDPTKSKDMYVSSEKISNAFSHHDSAKLTAFFIKISLELEFEPMYTQIDIWDYIYHVADGIRHFNSTVLALCLDLQNYINQEYILDTLKRDKHKVSLAITLSNCIENLNISSAILMNVSSKSPFDVIDYSLEANIGIAMVNSFNAIKNATSVLNELKF